MMRIRCLALAAAVLVTGCAPIRQPEGFLGKLWRFEVGPQYERPAVDTPEDFRGRLDPADAASFADLPWWQVFDDPTLHGLVGASLEGNYDLQAAVARIDQARAQIGVAASQFFPQVGYQERRRVRVHQAESSPRTSPARPSTCSSAPSTWHGRSTSGGASAAPRKWRRPSTWRTMRRDKASS